MPRNIEVKARIASVEALLPRATALADDAHVQRIHQDDTFFAAPRGRLKLRVFDDGSSELIQYERLDDDEGARRSDYRIAPVAEPEALRAVLAAALGELGRVRKVRLLALVGATRVHLDRVDGLGDFVELEVVLAPGDVDEAAAAARAEALLAALGVAPEARVRGAYVDLLRAAAGPHGAARTAHAV